MYKAQGFYILLSHIFYETLFFKLDVAFKWALNLIWLNLNHDSCIISYFTNHVFNLIIFKYQRLTLKVTKKTCNKIFLFFQSQNRCMKKSLYLCIWFYVIHVKFICRNPVGAHFASPSACTGEFEIAAYLNQNQLNYCPGVNDNQSTSLQCSGVHPSTWKQSKEGNLMGDTNSEIF